jgi:hypothetical protein
MKFSRISEAETYPPNMKKLFLILSLAVLALGIVPANAQFGPPGGGSRGPSFGGATGKLFGDNQSFSATLEFQTTDPSSNAITMPGKISFDAGKSRFEMNMTEVKGGQMPPDAAAQMKSMGMDTMVSLSRPDKKTVYLIYPGLQSYVENPMPEKAAATGDDFKIETTEAGKETVEGHDCVKNQVVVTDKDGKKHESTVWNATDLKKFPVKIVTSEQGQNSTMLFKKISFDKPAASNFEVPASFQKYDNMQTMMQQQMMKKMGGGMAMPPGQ